MTPASGNHVCFIIHAHRPYCFDLNEILALPSGFRYRNRFDEQWIEPQLHSNISTLNGMDVLIVLRDPENNTLVPVRWGKLDTVLTIGKVTYFEYKLGQLIKYNTSANVRRQEIAAHTDAFRSLHAWLPGTQGQPLSDPSVFISTVGLNLPRADASDLSAWGNAVSAVATSKAYESIEFLKVVGLFGAKNKTAPIVDESFVVAPNTVYTLRVFQTVPEPGTLPIPTHTIEVNTFPNHVVALRKAQKAVGKYDMLTFVLKVLVLRPGERTSMEIPHVPDASTTNNALTSLYLPLTVRDLQVSRVLLTLVLLIGSAFLMFRPSVFGVSPDTIRNIATLLFVLTLSGPSRTLSTIWPTWPWMIGK